MKSQLIIPVADQIAIKLLRNRCQLLLVDVSFDSPQPIFRMIAFRETTEPSFIKLLIMLFQHMCCR